MEFDGLTRAGKLMEDDFFGKAVIVAARIMAAADGGEILVSAVLRELAQGADGFAFEGGRTVELKGFSEPFAVFAVEWAEAEQRRARRLTRRERLRSAG